MVASRFVVYSEIFAYVAAVQKIRAIINETEKGTAKSSPDGVVRANYFIV